jgi:phage tail-like protein
MATTSNLDSGTGYSFGLTLDGITIKAITEVSGLKMEHDVIEVKQNTPEGLYVLKALPGRRKRATITLTRPLDGTQSFDQWLKYVHTGDMSSARITASISLYDVQGNVLKSYKLSNAWPTSLEVGSLKAGDTSVLTEKLVITAEDVEVE